MPPRPQGQRSEPESTSVGFFVGAPRDLCSKLFHILSHSQYNLQAEYKNNTKAFFKLYSLLLYYPFISVSFLTH